MLIVSWTKPFKNPTLDHMGVSNMTLISEAHPLSFKYKNKSIAEQNSVDLSWQLLMAPSHEKLRACICATEDEFMRFRSLVVNSVMATDIVSSVSNSIRCPHLDLPSPLINSCGSDGQRASSSSEGTMEQGFQ